MAGGLGDRPRNKVVGGMERLEYRKRARPSDRTLKKYFREKQLYSLLSQPENQGVWAPGQVLIS